MTGTLRVAVIGAGRMGRNHLQRLSSRIRGAEVAAVVGVDLSRTREAAADIPGAIALTSVDEALDRTDVNAVLIAAPGFAHQDILLRAIARDIPIFCEKPLTPDAQSSLRIVRAEQELGRKRIQLGFMRRFDAEYAALRQIIQNNDLGQLLMLHHQHRNPSSPPGFTNEMLINESVVHEFDAIRFFTGEEITSVQVRFGKATKNAPDGQHDPQHILIETESGVLADVEIYVNARYGYEVGTQASFEDGVISIGGHGGPLVTTAGRWGGRVAPGFEDRFESAYDVQIQSWVDAALEGEVGGPTAWDGYAAAASCEAGVEAQKSGEKVKVQLATKPLFYS